MATIAQLALKTFEDNWNKQATLDGFKAFKPEDKAAYLNEWMEKKMAAAIEIESNRVADTALQLQAAATAKQSRVDFLKSKGYKVDGSKADWEKLYFNPVVFGDNWKTYAATADSAAKGDIDTFVNKAFALESELAK